MILSRKKTNHHAITASERRRSIVMPMFWALAMGIFFFTNFSDFLQIPIRKTEQGVPSLLMRPADDHDLPIFLRGTGFADANAETIQKKSLSIPPFGFPHRNAHLDKTNYNTKEDSPTTVTNDHMDASDREAIDRTRFNIDEASTKEEHPNMAIEGVAAEAKETSTNEELPTATDARAETSAGEENDTRNNDESPSTTTDAQEDASDPSPEADENSTKEETSPTTTDAQLDASDTETNSNNEESPATDTDAQEDASDAAEADETSTKEESPSTTTDAQADASDTEAIKNSTKEEIPATDQTQVDTPAIVPENNETRTQEESTTNDQPDASENKNIKKESPASDAQLDTSGAEADKTNTNDENPATATNQTQVDESDTETHPTSDAQADASDKTSSKEETPATATVTATDTQVDVSDTGNSETSTKEESPAADTDAQVDASESETDKTKPKEESVATATDSTQEDAANAEGKETIPSITLGKDKDGKNVNMPLLGAGTWQFNDTQAYDSLCHSFKAGYNMVDTALGYGNAQGVGRAIRDCWNGTREELFILTKVNGASDHDGTIAMHQQNLEGMGVEYVDLLIVHNPQGGKESRKAQWKGLESLYKQGKARSIGVSHYCSNHIDDILESAEIRPVLNQVEYHVGVSKAQDVIMEKCTKENIYMMSFSPLCGPCISDPTNNWFDNGLASTIGKKYNKNGAQVALRYVVQQALEGTNKIAGVIPKSKSPEHIKENKEIFDFELTQEDMDQLRSHEVLLGEPGDCKIE